MDQDFPLISCLCVTRNTPRQVRRVIDCFLRQTYPNKELIIVFEEGDDSLTEFMGSISHHSIVVYKLALKPKRTLGNLRNLSIELSKGEYFCQWDGDDWYHNSRLEMQMEAIRRSHKPCTFLTYWLMYDQSDNRSFLSPVGLWSGSLLCKKSLIMGGIRYPDYRYGEDTPLMQDLIDRNYVYPLVMPSLYIYSFHGNNTCGKSHFDQLYSHSQELGPHITQLFQRIFEGKISCDDASLQLSDERTLRQMNYFHYSQLPALTSSPNGQPR